MKTLQEILEHLIKYNISLLIQYNPGAVYHETVEHRLSFYDEDNEPNWATPECKQICIATNQIWECNISRNSVGSWDVRASSLDKLVVWLNNHYLDLR